ncbi:MAG: hypothetical protein ACYCZB_10585 [Acidiphilium sp.]
MSSSRPRPVTFAERFAWNLRAIREVLAHHGVKGIFAGIVGPIHAIPFARSLCIRFDRILNRFNTLLENYRDNIPPPPPHPSRAKPRLESCPIQPRLVQPAPPTPFIASRIPALPRRFAWLPSLVPEVRGFAGNLRLMLDEPEMQALIAADPRAGRTLRPLCRLLGIKLPPSLQLPKTKPTPRRKLRPCLARPKHPLIHDSLALHPPTTARPNRRTQSRAPPAWG